MVFWISHFLICWNYYWRILFYHGILLVSGKTSKSKQLQLKLLKDCLAKFTETLLEKKLYNSEIVILLFHFLRTISTRINIINPLTLKASHMVTHISNLNQWRISKENIWRNLWKNPGVIFDGICKWIPGGIPGRVP